MYLILPIGFHFAPLTIGSDLPKPKTFVDISLLWSNFPWCRNVYLDSDETAKLIMSNLTPKATKTSALSFAVTGAVGWFFPLTRITLGLIALAFVLSSLALFIAEMKNKQWSQFAWIWSDFFLPYMLAQFLFLDYLIQYVAVKYFLIILALYIAVLPFLLSIMYKNLYHACRFL